MEKFTANHLSHNRLKNKLAIHNSLEESASPANLDKPSLWSEDIKRSVDMYNRWFLEFAPQTFVDARERASEAAREMMKLTSNLRNISPEVFKANPSILSAMRMITAPPIARDRLAGLSKTSRSFILSMEKHNRIPPKMKTKEVEEQLKSIGALITNLADPTLFPWLDEERSPTTIEVTLAATVIGDRLCGALSDPIIRNAQEARQISTLREYLENKGYLEADNSKITRLDEMKVGTYAIRLIVQGKQEDGSEINIPTDLVIKRKSSNSIEFPLLIEAKSAGDFTNVNKRRKEEAKKMDQLRRMYGDSVPYLLFLCGYFNTNYLEYEARARIDWIWEHRIDDLEEYDV